MSDADDRCDIEREYEEAKKTAREYLRAVGVLSPEGKDKQERDTEQRWREERKMRNTILRGWAPDAVVPNDPSARDATNLGRQYLHCGRDDDSLGRSSGKGSLSPGVPIGA